MSVCCWPNAVWWIFDLWFEISQAAHPSLIVWVCLQTQAPDPGMRTTVEKLFLNALFWSGRMMLSVHYHTISITDNSDKQRRIITMALLSFLLQMPLSLWNVERKLARLRKVMNTRCSQPCFARITYHHTMLKVVQLHQTRALGLNLKTQHKHIVALVEPSHLWGQIENTCPWQEARQQLFWLACRASIQGDWVHTNRQVVCEGNLEETAEREGGSHFCIQEQNTKGFHRGQWQYFPLRLGPCVSQCVTMRRAAVGNYCKSTSGSSRVRKG